MIVAGIARRETPWVLRALILNALLFGAGCGRSELLRLRKGVEGVDAGHDVFMDPGQDASPEVKREAGREVGRSDGRKDGGGWLTLLAGGLGGAGTQDGVGAAARFNAPWAAASDGAGHLLVTDGNDTIRSVDLDTGVVTTLAGLGTGSQDGTGAGASFSGPSGIVSDGAGNLFVADSRNHTIRKIVIATGKVTTLAGSAGQGGTDDGTGSTARFNTPTSLAYESGHLFVLSGGIRRVVIATGVVTTLRLSLETGRSDAGSDTPIFKNPKGITSDGAGNLFVVDRDLHTVFKVVIATGAVSRAAGTAQSGCDVGIGGGRSFCFPEDVVSDKMGNLYVADCGYHTIRKVTIAPRDVTTIAGSGELGSSDGSASTASFSGGYRLALDGSGDLFVVDTRNNTLRKIVTPTGQVTSLAGAARQQGTRNGTGAAARFASPRGLALDQSGDLFVADSPSHTIRRVTATGEVTTFAGHAGQQGSGNGKGTEAYFNTPLGVASDGEGNLFVTDSGNHRIRKIVVPTGQVTTFAGTGRDEQNDGPASAAGFSKPSVITSDGAGNLFVADARPSTIRKLVIATGEVTTMAASYVSVAGLASDGTGDLFVADPSQKVIWRLLAATGETALVAGSPNEPGWQDGTGTVARFGSPGALVLDEAGTLYVADSAMVRQIDVATGAVTTVVGSATHAGVVLGVLPGSLGLPSGLALGPTGELYISDDLEPAILVARFW